MNIDFYNWLQEQKYDWNVFNQTGDNKLWMLKSVYDYYHHPSPYDTLVKSGGWEGYDWEDVLRGGISRSLVV